MEGSKLEVRIAVSGFEVKSLWLSRACLVKDDSQNSTNTRQKQRAQ